MGLSNLFGISAKLNSFQDALTVMRLAMSGQDPNEIDFSQLSPDTRTSLISLANNFIGPDTTPDNGVDEPLLQFVRGQMDTIKAHLRENPTAIVDFVMEMDGQEIKDQLTANPQSIQPIVDTITQQLSQQTFAQLMTGQGITPETAATIPASIGAQKIENLDLTNVSNEDLRTLVGTLPPPMFANVMEGLNKAITDRGGEAMEMPTANTAEARLQAFDAAVDRIESVALVTPAGQEPAPQAEEGFFAGLVSSAQTMIAQAAPNNPAIQAQIEQGVATEVYAGVRKGIMDAITPIRTGEVNIATMEPAQIESLLRSNRPAIENYMKDPNNWDSIEQLITAERLAKDREKFLDAALPAISAEAIGGFQNILSNFPGLGGIIQTFLGFIEGFIGRFMPDQTPDPEVVGPTTEPDPAQTAPGADPAAAEVAAAETERRTQPAAGTTPSV